MCVGIAVVVENGGGRGGGGRKFQMWIGERRRKETRQRVRVYYEFSVFVSFLLLRSVCGARLLQIV